MFHQTVTPVQSVAGVDAKKFTSLFGSTYCCEQLFSRLKNTKTKSRSMFTDEHSYFDFYCWSRYRLFMQTKTVPDFTL